MPAREKSLPVVLPAVFASLLVLGCSSLSAGGDQANLSVNPDFESGLPGQAAPGWITWQKLDGSVFRLVRDPSLAHAGSQCVSIQQTVNNQFNYAVWLQELPANARRTYRYSF